MKQNIQIQAKNETVNIYMYGFIASWEVGGQKLVEQLSVYEKDYKKLNVYINSNGGDVIEGITLFNILSRTSLELSFYVDGAAASMAAILLFVPGAKRYMSKYSQIMLHSVTGGSNGSSEKLRETADMMDEFQTSLIQMMSDGLNLPVDKVKANYFDGKDHWFNATQALKSKLIDGIVDGKVNEKPANTNSMIDVIDFYDKQITNFNNKIETMDLTVFINALSMSAGSTEAQVLDGIKAQVAKVTTLEAKVQTLEGEKSALQAKVDQADKDKVANLVDAAVTAKKITAEQKATYVALAEVDFDNTKKVLDSMKGYVPINGQLNPEDNSVVNLTDDEKKFTFNDFMAKAPQKLMAIKQKDSELFNKLYKDQFGKDVPKA